MKYSNSACNPMCVIDNESVSQYINSFCVTTKGSWLISGTYSDNLKGSYCVYVRRSEDKGLTWSERIPAYNAKIEGEHMAIEMGQLCSVEISKNNGDPIHRLYQFHVIRNLKIGARFGRLVFQYSDDDGLTWQGSKGRDSVYEVETPMYQIVSTKYCWHLMGPWVKLKNGQCVLPVAVATDPPSLVDIRSETVFLFSKNINKEIDPGKMKFEFYPEPPHGITVDLKGDKTLSLSQEAQLVELSDGRLMTVMRTGNGCIYYSVSQDGGIHWSESNPLRYKNGGEIIEQPNAPCPFNALSNGRFSLLICNNDGRYNGGKDPFEHTKNRQPVYITIGREVGKDKSQPIEFSAPKLLCAIDGFREDVTWRDLTYGYFAEIEGEYYHFYNAVWRSIQVNKVDPYLTTG